VGDRSPLSPRLRHLCSQYGSKKAWAFAKYEASQHLGVVLNDKLTAEDHVGSILTSCSSSLHCEFSVATDCQPTRSETFSRYDSRKDTLLCPAWSRASARQVIVQDWVHSYDVARNNYGYCAVCADDVPTTVTDLFAATDQSLFKRVLNNELHVLQPLLPDKTISKLRPRKHDRQLIT